MGRGLSEQQSHVLQVIRRNGFITRSILLSDGDPVASASISRALSRLVRRGLIEKFHHQFSNNSHRCNWPKGVCRRGEFRWRLTEKAIG